MGEDAGTDAGKLSPDELRLVWRKLARKLKGGADFPCRFCGELAWDVTEPLRFQPSPDYSTIAGVLHYADAKTGELIGVMHTVPFFCGNCGCVEVFAEPQLVALAKRHGVLG